MQQSHGMGRGLPVGMRNSINAVHFISLVTLSGRPQLSAVIFFMPLHKIIPTLIGEFLQILDLFV
jgi:hypothetical protein